MRTSCRSKARKKIKKRREQRRYYAYLTKNEGELCKVTVAVKCHKGEWYCKQCAVLGVHSDYCFVKDMKYTYGMSGYSVGWYDLGLSKRQEWYEDGKWYENDFLFQPWALTVNKEYLSKLPEYRYSAYEQYTGNDVFSYICTRCGFITDELPKMTERHPVGDGCAEETVSSWLHSCGGEFDRAKTCKTCGETKSEEDNLFHGNVCEDCLKEAAKDFEIVKKCSDKGNSKVTVEIDSLVVALLSPMKINTVLWEYIKSACESSSFGFLLKGIYEKKAEKWALNDLDWFSDMICEVSEIG